MSRAIDADALEKEGWSLHRTIQVDKNTSEYQIKSLRQVPTIEPQIEPQCRMVYGYSLEYLVAFAEACRRAGVDESNLKTFANNCEFAYATMAEEYRHNIGQVIDAFMGNAGGTAEAFKECANMVYEQPTIEPRNKGHWIKISPANIYECSECGKNVMTDDISAYDFCHGCGADMTEGEG